MARTTKATAASIQTCGARPMMAIGSMGHCDELRGGRDTLGHEVPAGGSIPARPMLGGHPPGSRRTIDRQSTEDRDLRSSSRHPDRQAKPPSVPLMTVPRPLVGSTGVERRALLDFRDLSRERTQTRRTQPATQSERENYHGPRSEQCGREGRTVQAIMDIEGCASSTPWALAPASTNFNSRPRNTKDTPPARVADHGRDSRWRRCPDGQGRVVQSRVDGARHRRHRTLRRDSARRRDRERPAKSRASGTKARPACSNSNRLRPWLRRASRSFKVKMSIFCRGAGRFSVVSAGPSPDFRVARSQGRPGSHLCDARRSGVDLPTLGRSESAAFGSVLRRDGWGFDRPILHGLCSYGFTGRALLHTLCGSDSESFSRRSTGDSRSPSCRATPLDDLYVDRWERSALPDEESERRYRHRSGRLQVRLVLWCSVPSQRPLRRSECHASTLIRKDPREADASRGSSVSQPPPGSTFRVRPRWGGVDSTQ